MRFLSGQRFHLIFGLALGLLAVLIGISYQGLAELVETAERNRRSLEIHTRLDDLAFQVDEAERLQGEFCVKRDETSLASFQQTRVQATQIVFALRQLTAGNSRFHNPLLALGDCVASRMEILQQLIDQALGLAEPAGGREELLASSQKLRQEITERIAALKRLERIIMIHRDQDASTSVQFTGLLVTLGGLLAFVLVGLATVLAFNEEAIRRRAEEVLRLTLDATEARVRERTAELAEANAAQQALTRELIQAQEAERRRLARELHDEIGQVLTAVKMNLQAMTASGGLKGAREDAAFLRRIQDSIAIVEQALQQVRNLSLDLRPSLLDDLGLVAALRWYVDRQAKRAGFEGQFQADPPRLEVPPELATACFRVAQEALTNVSRHARATQVAVHLNLEDGELRLIVRDNGSGFDVRQARQRAAQGGSLGLLGMQERAQLVGGRMEVESAPGQGTVVRVRFPLAAYTGNGAITPS